MRYRIIAKTLYLKNSFQSEYGKFFSAMGTCEDRIVFSLSTASELLSCSSGNPKKPLCFSRPHRPLTDPSASVSSIA